jgi:hypothetical protein
MKYARRNNGVITGFAVRPTDATDQNPIDETSQEWIDYLAPKDHIVVRKQSAYRYLKSTGEWDSIRAILAADINAKEEWDAVVNIKIDDSFLLAMAPVLGWDAAKLQFIFNEANA